MALVRTAKGATQASATSSTIASVAMSTGDLIIVGGTVTTSVVDNVTVTWGGESLTQNRFQTETAGATAKGVVFSKIITTGGTQTVTFTPDGGSSRKHAWWVIQVTGAASASPFDVAESDEAAGTGSNAPNSGATTTTAQADEILMGNVGYLANVAVGGTWSNSFNDGQSANTTGGGAGANASVNEGYLVVAATGTYTAAKTGCASTERWTCIVATYKAAADVPLPYTNRDSWQRRTMDKIEIVSY